MATNLLLICIILTSTPFGDCWMYFESYPEYGPNLTNSDLERKSVHSEYRYGVCDGYKIKFYAHVHLDALEVLGKLLIRGWLDIRRIPTCIIMRASSFYHEQGHMTGYPFQMCVPRIVYCHSHLRYRYYFYEWHLPFNYAGGMEWDLYFYGSPSMTW